MCKHITVKNLTRTPFVSQVRMQDYAPLQASHVFDKTRRASSVPPLPPNWTPAKRDHAGSSHTLSLTNEPQGRLGSKVKALSSTSQDSEQSEKLREYFLASIKNKRCPQNGKMTEQTRNDIQVRKEDRLQNLALEREVCCPCQLLLLFFSTYKQTMSTRK